MRTWLNDVRSYMDPIKIGAVMRAGGIGRVVQSRSSELRSGDLGSLFLSFFCGFWFGGMTVFAL